ncbi:MAG: hypothetical protein M9911_09235 [Saprospiraceae bacterium]|jgi:hypothetical protein|nr:hypothetical protein [Saprospiraceae bacterium]
MRNRFTTRNQWFTETIETIRTSGLTLIISTIRFFKTFIAGLHLTKLQHTDYHTFGNILIRDYLNFNTKKKLASYFLKKLLYL